MPTYNEAENLPQITEALFKLPIPELNVLVVDDNSPDGTGISQKNWAYLCRAGAGSASYR
jgi:glycosyltransferase involved in cell wall biosynthesis